MMVHDPRALPPFETPWDGETSIAVCTSPETVDDMGLDALQAYLGFFAWKVDALATITLTLPSVTNGPVRIEVWEFWNMQPTSSRIATLGGDRTLVLEPGRTGELGAATLWLLALALLGAGGVLIALHMRDVADP